MTFFTKVTVNPNATQETLERQHVVWNKGLTGCHSAEALAKISMASKGRICSAETRAKIGAANKEHSTTGYQRQRLSEIHTGKTISAEHRAKISAANKGQNRMSFEARSQLHKGKIVSAETRAKISAANKPRAVMTYYGIYPSIRAVAEAANATPAGVRYWMKKYPEHYYYV